ncbi:MAG: NAD-dependent epimerase/dehydratase family protein [Candidatus Parcubacteria bacterium]|nr:NAD-dependent epimerase/dehydratase family protein [Candidatus Parcubacteria bacterium]
MKILITGGAGFIGSHLGLSLLQQKHQVLFLDNLSFGYLENLNSNNNPKPHFINMDVRDPEIGKSMEGVNVVFHFAGISSLPECQSDPGQAYEINVAGTANVLEAARRHNVGRIIFSSTSAIYENETSFPTPENPNPDPTLIYSLSKKHAEEVCHSFQKLYGMDIAILRFFNVYGPHMDFRRPNPPLISYLIRCFLNKEAPILHSDGNQARDLVYVDDIVSACEAVMTNKNAKNQTFNIGSGKSYSIKEIYKYVAKAFGSTDKNPVYRTAKLLWDKYPQLSEGNYPFQAKFLEKEVNKYTQASIKKANELLEWKPQISLEEGLQKTVAFAIKNK